MVPWPMHSCLGNEEKAVTVGFRVSRTTFCKVFRSDQKIDTKIYTKSRVRRAENSRWKCGDIVCHRECQGGTCSDGSDRTKDAISVRL